MYNPLVSIIIPVYNGSNFLSQAIDSALAQTYKNLEIIVVNDGSNDNGETERIAQSYGEKVRYYLKKNGGVSSALNYAIKRTRGEWFSWLSHDDLYYPTKIEKQIEYINELLIEDPHINIKKITVRSATVSINREGKVIKTPSYKGIKQIEKPIDTILNNISDYRLSGCSFLLPKSCLDDIGGFNESVRTVSDVEYWYRLLFAGYEFHCLTNDILVKNRSHGKQVGKVKKELFNHEMNNLFVWIVDTMNMNKEYATKKNNEVLYYFLIKRRCKAVAKYVRLAFLKKSASWSSYYLKYPMISTKYAFCGIIRQIVRYVYRKIFVR